jgi:hypothetical protein
MEKRNEAAPNPVWRYNNLGERYTHPTLGAINESADGFSCTIVDGTFPDLQAAQAAASMRATEMAEQDERVREAYIARVAG